ESFLAELKNGAKEFDLSATPDLVPSLAVCAATLNCETKLQNIGHLRHKESDRIHALATELARVGAKVQELKDTLIIQGGNLHGAEIETYGDHRIAMSFAALGTKVAGMKIRDTECVNKSYPEFWEEMEKVISA
ncbi:MAG: 3-phosphoshikimate 1-carboxyvinyltransferase, partial [Candidatus Gracilibacteria bacterium]|nr:3-phosphoshikimate 1-carboxyvinyltransferase [Candidatus Gracilibacteria bacterium]